MLRPLLELGFPASDNVVKERKNGRRSVVHFGFPSVDDLSAAYLALQSRPISCLGMNSPVVYTVHAARLFGSDVCALNGGR